MSPNPSVTSHDKLQDKRIEVNRRLIETQTKYLEEIRNHFLPEQVHTESKKLRTFITRMVTRAVLGFAFVCGLWETLGWYFDRWEIRNMACGYADVARDMYYNENNPEIALEFLNRAIELQETDAEFRFLRAYIDGMAVARTLLNLDRPFNKEELDQAHQALAQALFLAGLEPERPEAFILQGQILMLLKETDRAEAALRKALQLDPSSDFAHVRMATFLIEKGDLDTATTHVNKALELNPESKWGYLWKGVLLRDRDKDYQGARAAYEKALELDPRFDLAWYNKGWTWVTEKEKDYDQAKAAMEKALLINPEYKEAYYAIGMFYGYQDNYTVARLYMDKALDIDPQFLTALKWRGIIWGEMGKYEEALQDFEAALRVDPMNADLYVRRAKMREMIGQLDEALQDLRFATELDPGSKRTALYFGNLFLKAGDPKSALEHFDRAIGLDEAYDDAHSQKSAALIELGQNDEALAAVDTAIKLALYKPERFWVQKGLLLQKIGRPSDALACFIKARELNDRLADAWRKEYEILNEKGETDGATVALSAYLKLKPSDEEARQIIEGLKRGSSEPVAGASNGL